MQSGERYWRDRSVCFRVFPPGWKLTRFIGLFLNTLSCYAMLRKSIVAAFFAISVRSHSIHGSPIFLSPSFIEASSLYPSSPSYSLALRKSSNSFLVITLSTAWRISHPRLFLRLIIRTYNPSSRTLSTGYNRFRASFTVRFPPSHLLTDLS